MEKVALDANKYAADWEMPSRRKTLSDVTDKVVADCYAAGARFAGHGEESVYAGADKGPVYAKADNDNRRGDWMQTFTGRQFWPMDPRPDEIFIEDIAHSLAMQCRYAGHSIWFYSVAEHAVLMARWFMAQGMYDEAEQALHHDDPETYLVDVPRPVKPFLPGYKQAEHTVWLAVAERFGLSSVISPSVHEADGRILSDERAQNMAPCVTDWNLTGEPLGVTLQFWSPEQAEREFLSTYWNLVEQARP